MILSELWGVGSASTVGDAGWFSAAEVSSLTYAPEVCVCADAGVAHCAAARSDLATLGGSAMVCFAFGGAGGMGFTAKLFESGAEERVAVAALERLGGVDTERCELERRCPEIAGRRDFEAVAVPGVTKADCSTVRNGGRLFSVDFSGGDPAEFEAFSACFALSQL